MKGFKWLIFFSIALLVSFLLFPRELSIASINTFLFMDKLLRISDLVQPFMIWAALGIIVGIVAGSFVAWKKYNIEFKWNIVPVIIFILTISVLFIVNKPLSSGVTTLTKRPEIKIAYAYYFIKVPTVTNFLPSTNGNRNDARNLVDNNLTTAWIENAYGPGINERINFLFPREFMNQLKELKCVGFMIKNGNCKSYTQWIEYNKLNEFTISYNFKPVRHAKASNNFTTKEEIKFLPIPINPGAIISITINSVYPGTRKKDKTAISELIPIIEYY